MTYTAANIKFALFKGQHDFWMFHKAANRIICGIGHDLTQGSIALEADGHALTVLHRGCKQQCASCRAAQSGCGDRTQSVDFIHILCQVGCRHGIDPGIPDSRPNQDIFLGHFRAAS